MGIKFYYDACAKTCQQGNKNNNQGNGNAEGV